MDKFFVEEEKLIHHEIRKTRLEYSTERMSQNLNVVIISHSREVISSEGSDGVLCRRQKKNNNESAEVNAILFRDGRSLAYEGTKN